MRLKEFVEYHFHDFQMKTIFRCELSEDESDELMLSEREIINKLMQQTGQ